MKKYLVLAFLMPVFSFGQMTELEVRNFVKTASEAELLIMNSQMMQENYLYQADIVADKLLTFNPQSSNYNYRKGYVLLESKMDYQTAMRHFMLAILDVDKNYDMYSTNEKSASIDAYYHLARCYHLDEQINEARKYYQMFIDNSANKSGTKELAELGLLQCDVAEREISMPKSAIVKNIGSRVNTDYPEYAPVVSLDGASLYFTSRRGWDDGSTDDLKDPKLNQFPEDIFVSFADFEGEWTSPEKLAFCESEYNEATIGVSSDERRIYVYEDQSGGGDIYFSDFQGNKFDQLTKLDYNDVNTKYWETHCTMTPDGQNMYFVSDRPGGYGGRDIYRLVRLPNGEWSKAQNMGPTINTPYDEDSPFIAVNNKTLYYSSNGEQSMGGFDVFVTFRNEDNVFSTPANMGYPINSTGDDVFYTTTIDGLKGYLSSFRKDGFGEKDIYEIKNDYLGNRPISTLRGKFISVTGADLPPDLNVKITCLNCEKEEDKFIDPRIKRGSFFAVLARCKDYKIEFFDGTDLIASENFVTLCSGENEEIIKNQYIGKFLMAGTVSNSEDFAPIEGAKVEISDYDTKELLASYNTSESGIFNSDLLDGKRTGDRVHYSIKITKDKYVSQTFEVDTILGKWSKLRLDYLLTPKKIGALIVVNPIYFDVDKSNIRPDAAKELDKIVSVMNDNPEIKIELGSHTDCRASKTYNLKLSERRAQSSAAYIRKRITNPDRISGRGYGENQLVNDCGCEGNVTSDCSEEEHQANRRTEFKIIEESNN